MPLQNRVDPWGGIHAAPERGLFTGNRGVIHDPATRTLLKRRWSTKAWIVCVCDYKGRRRDVMGRNAPSGNAGWTELFFLDEVTALAAGHRPCFYCRREKAKAFAKCFSAGAVTAAAMDERLHGERLASGGSAALVGPDAFAALPDGAMLCCGDRAFAKCKGRLRAWSFGGYGDASSFEAHGDDLRLITPPSTIAALKAGYRPVWHRSIDRSP